MAPEPDEILRPAIFRPDAERVRRIVCTVLVVFFAVVAASEARRPDLPTVGALLPYLIGKFIVLAAVIGVEAFFVFRWQSFLYTRECRTLASLDLDDSANYVTGELAAALPDQKFFFPLNGRIYRSVRLANGEYHRVHFEARLDETFPVRFYRFRATFTHPFGIRVVVPESAFELRDPSVDRAA